MRASNLQDLVYKNGQAGITKASVSITFDNSDKKQSPLGFEVHDEITVTRQVSGNQTCRPGRHFDVSCVWGLGLYEKRRGEKKFLNTSVASNNVKIP